MKVKLIIEYSGVGFAGWQFQPGLRTIQGELERALNIILSSLVKKLALPELPPISITSSGRTDAGVHAKAQVASFSWPEALPLELNRLKQALNGLTPREIVIRDVTVVNQSFNARTTAHIKCYSYKLCLRHESGGLASNRAWTIGPGVNLAKMIECARVFKGEHDFINFRDSHSHAKTTVRTILCSELTRLSNDRVLYVVQGKGFLKQMIRRIVGVLVEVGRGKLNLAQVQELLKGNEHNFKSTTAPPYGLTLEWVRY